jgi:hypothetical protein
MSDAEYAAARADVDAVRSRAEAIDRLAHAEARRYRDAGNRVMMRAALDAGREARRLANIAYGDFMREVHGQIVGMTLEEIAGQ